MLDWARFRILTLDQKIEEKNMETISAEQIGGNIATILARVTSSKDPLIITAEDSQPVVMVNLAEFQSLQETLYLLSNPANVTHLQKSISDLDNNRGIPMELADL